MKIDQIDKMTLLDMGLEHVVYLQKDVSVKTVGSVCAAFTMKADARKHCAWLNEMYESVEKEAHAVQDLTKL